MKPCGILSTLLKIGLVSLFFAPSKCASTESVTPVAPPAAPPGSSSPGAGPSGNNAADFPTIAGLDFSRFKADPGEACPGQRSWHVSTQGQDGAEGSQQSPLRSIAEALRRAGDKDAVIVAAGTYRETFSDGDFRSLSIAQNGLFLCAAPGAEVSVEAPAGVNYGMEISGNDVVVNGIDLKGYSILVNLSGNGVVLKNLHLQGGGTGFRDGISVQAGSAHQLLLQNLTVEGAHLAISCNSGPCNDWRFDRVVVRSDSSQGDTGSDAVAIESGDNFLFSNLEISGAAGDGVDIKGTRVAVFNANIHDNSRNGVKFWRGGDLVNSFVVKHGADAAVVFDGGGSYRILNSLIGYENYPGGGSYTATVGYDHQAEAITLQIINSVFYNNSGAIWLSPATQGTFRNNFFAPVVEGEIAAKGDARVLNADGPAALKNLGEAFENLSFSSNPQFQNPPQDFSFPNSSPLKDAGNVPNVFPFYDFRGKTRSLGAAPDLGPLELF